MRKGKEEMEEGGLENGKTIMKEVLRPQVTYMYMYVRMHSLIFSPSLPPS